MNLLFVFIAALTLSFAQEDYCTLSGGRYSIISVSSGHYLYGKPYWHVMKLNNGKYALKSVSSGNYLQSMANVAANAILGSKGVDISDDIKYINLQWTFIGINADCNIIRIRSVSNKKLYLSDIGGENEQWKLARHGVRRSLIETGVTSVTSQLSIRETNDYETVWNDNGSGADDDVSFWRPKLFVGEAFLSFVATDSKDTEPTYISSMVISSYPAAALADPISFSLIWNDGGSGADKDVSWWRAKAPVDYVCFGDFVFASHATPNIPSDLDGYKCVHVDYVVSVANEGFSTKKVWDDDGSGADMNGAVYQISSNEYPKYYYKMSDMKSVEQAQNDLNTGITPYYALNTYPNDCRVLNTVISNEQNTMNQLLHGVADSSTSIYTSNAAPYAAPFQVPGSEICETLSQQFSHTSGYSYGIGVTVGYTTTASAEFAGVGVSVESSFEVSVNAEYHSDSTETNTVSTQTCNTWEAFVIDCPARSICNYEVIKYSASDEQLPVSITLQCPTISGDEIEIIEGSVIASGTASIQTYITTTPMDCIYYTNDYYDRGNGRLPFCDTCIDNNQCDICRDEMIEIEGQCYPWSVCVDQCKGEVYGPGLTGSLQEAPFSGGFCKHEKIWLKSCQDALFI